MEYVTLNNGIKMPMVGLGTANLPVTEMKEIIRMAYELGYKKFDTAWLYKNEQSIGDAIKELGIPRNEVFITTKLNNHDLYTWNVFGKTKELSIKSKSVRKAFLNSCKRLHVDYIDLYLIHWPYPNFLYLWEEIEKLYKDGLVKAIGVSSFLPPHLEKLKAVSDIVPAVNQFEINPLNTNKECIAYCKENGIHVEAYATFGTSRKNEVASKDIIQSDVVSQIAISHGKTASQIVLKWAVQQGISVIPRSKSKQHLSENLGIFDFELSESEMSQIDNMNRNMYSRFDPHATLSY